jgi:hypothetical protein
MKTVKIEIPLNFAATYGDSGKIAKMIQVSIEKELNINCNQNTFFSYK